MGDKETKVEKLLCMGSSLAIGDDSDQGDACECRRKRIDGPVAFCQGSVQYRVPCEPDRRPFAPRQRSNFQDFGPTPAYQQG